VKTIRVKAERTVVEEADVLIRVPDELNDKHPMFFDYITDMVYDIASLDGCWELVETQDRHWNVIADPYVEIDP
jgi:hypothetical protein